jgi:hypothetical protein
MWSLLEGKAEARVSSFGCAYARMDLKHVYVHGQAAEGLVPYKPGRAWTRLHFDHFSWVAETIGLGSFLAAILG